MGRCAQDVFVSVASAARLSHYALYGTRAFADLPCEGQVVSAFLLTPGFPHYMSNPSPQATTWPCRDRRDPES